MGPTEYHYYTLNLPSYDMNVIIILRTRITNDIHASISLKRDRFTFGQVSNLLSTYRTESVTH